MYYNPYFTTGSKIGDRYEVSYGLSEECSCAQCGNKPAITAEADCHGDSEGPLCKQCWHNWIDLQFDSLIEKREVLSEDQIDHHGKIDYYTSNPASNKWRLELVQKDRKIFKKLKEEGRRVYINVD